MKRFVPAAIIALCLIIAGAGWAASLERVDEVWRSLGGWPLVYGQGGVNQSDGSVWLAEGYSLVHLSPAGEVVGRAPRVRAPALMTASPVDGSCWAGHDFADGLMHVASDGTTLSTPPLFWVHRIAVSPFDSSVWVVHSAWDDLGTPYLSHVSAAGEELVRLDNFFDVVVDPVDGSAWGGSRTSTVRWRADGTQVWSRPYTGNIIDEDPRDQSVWLVWKEPGTAASVIRHLSALGNLVRETTGLTDAPIELHVSHTDGSVWIWYTGLEYPYANTLVHCDTSGAQVASLDGAWVEAYNDLDGSLWVGSQITDPPGGWQLVQYSANLQEMNRFAWSGLLAYDQAANTFWLIVELASGGCDLQRVGPDGTVLWSEPIPLLSVLPQVPSPEDGSVWIDDRRGTYARYSPEGVEKEQGVSFPGLTGGISYVLPSPTDGSLWVAGYDVPIMRGGIPTLIHLSSAGAPLATHSGAGLEPQLDARDGTVWIAGNEWTWVGSDNVCTGRLHHFGADDTELLTKEYAGGLSAVLVAGDGSVWVQMGDLPGGPLEHLSAAGEPLGSLTPGIADAVYALSPADGSFYFASDEGTSDGPAGKVGRAASDGSILWVQEGFEHPSIAVDPDDGSVWAGDATTPVGGPAVIHYAADGTELWQGDMFSSPRLAALDRRDGSVWVSDAQGQTIHLAPSPFLDVAANSWAFDEISACFQAGIVQGFGGGTYQPDLAVTRDAMATYIARAVALPTGDAAVPTGPAVATFEDVPNTGYGDSGTDPYWAYKYIEYCVAQGVVQGYDATHYAPDRVVTRDQMAVFMARAKQWVHLGDDMTTAPQLFSDVPAGFWCGTAVQACVEHGVVQGYADGSYHPERLVTRDQMAVYVARAFGLDY